jgi:hypothetical protein
MLMRGFDILKTRLTFEVVMIQTGRGFCGFNQLEGSRKPEQEREYPQIDPRQSEKVNTVMFVSW